MNRLLFLLALVALVASVPKTSAAREDAPTRAQVEAMMGMPSQGDRVRGQMDTVGFAVTEDQGIDVVDTAICLEHASLAEQDARLGMTDGEGFIGGVCPHDDHLYASRIYVHLTDRITAPRVVLIGVFHRAKSWDFRDRLVFDAFDAWHGPWGEIKIDPIRDRLISALPSDSYVVDNVMHCREHSLEAITPFLQRGYPGRTIVPILVPPMKWDRLQELTDDFAVAIVDLLRTEGWALGTDLAIVVSSDAVHYGPDFDHAPFGVDIEAYEKATARDRLLALDHLEGEVNESDLRSLFETLVDPETLEYRLPWCGRFSIPFGLELLRKVTLMSTGASPQGILLRYGTSLSEPELPVSPATRASGLGYTAPSNLHHWVGYAAVGFRLP